MGVMSIPCCEVGCPEIKETGPVLVRAGWHHFVTMTRTGKVTTWIPKTPLVVNKMDLETLTGVTSDYWETGDKIANLRYRGSADWIYLDTSYDINKLGVSGSCRELSQGHYRETGTNLQLGIRFQSIFQGYGPAGDGEACCVNRNFKPGDEGIKDCSATYFAEGHECHAKCGYVTDRTTVANNSYWENPYPTGYMNPDGSTDGTGVTLDITASIWDPYQQTPGTTGPYSVKHETQAEKAPPGHPLETPEICGFVVDIECGAYHNIVRLSDNSIMAWGLNSMGQCNVPESLLPSSLRPAGVAPHPKKGKILSLHCGFSTSAVMFNDGTVLCWGDAEVADEVNTWEFIMVSPIKRRGAGQDSCIGTPSRGYPELLPGGDPMNPSDWVAEELYKKPTYNANTDWWGHWHNNKTPGYPHFDLGVVTEYVNPVNWKYLTGIFQDEDQGGDQWSYRFATKAGGGESPCATRGKNIKDYAVAMLRTGQIITTNKHNGSYAPDIRKDNGLSCRDCNTDLVIELSNGVYMPSHATASVKDGAPTDNPTIDCVAQAIEFTGGRPCRDPIVCEAYKVWGFTDTDICGANGYFTGHVSEGVGCFSSSIQERGYNPNWASASDRYTSAGHALGNVTEKLGYNHPSWNTAEANYGWASLGSRGDRYRAYCGFCNPGCRVNYFLPNCASVVAQNDPCDAECPSSAGGNRKGLPAGIGDSFKGNNGYFRYPEHLMGFGCVAGTNTTTWLGPATMLTSALTEIHSTSDYTVNSIPQELVDTYSKKIFNTSRGDPCAECAFSGSSIDHNFHLANISRGCLYHIDPDPENNRNPLIDGGDCVYPGPKRFANHSEMLPSKPWGPFQVTTNLGNLPAPPILEAIAIETRLGGGAPYTVSYNGIKGYLAEYTDPLGGGNRILWSDSFSFRGPADLTMNIMNSKIASGLMPDRGPRQKYIDFPVDFFYFSYIDHIGFNPVAAAYTVASTCACWMDESETGDAIYDPNGCRGGGATDGSDKPACSGRMPLDCGRPGKRYNPTTVSATRDFGTGFTLEEQAQSRGILCSAINLTGDKFATAGTALVGESTINIWRTAKGEIPHKPYKEITLSGTQDICGIKFISTDELFIRFDDESRSEFAILNIETKKYTPITIPTDPYYSIGSGGDTVRNVLSANQTAVSLKQPGSNSFRFITVNPQCNKVLLFKYIESPSFTGFNFETAFDAETIFAGAISNVKAIKENAFDGSGVGFPIISGLEISKDGNTIAVGEGTNIFSTVLWGITTCAGSTCIRDIGLTFALDKNRYTELPSYDYEKGDVEVNSAKQLVGLSQTVIRFNESETSIGVYGKRIGPFTPDKGVEYSWQAKIWNLCYSSNTSTPCSRLINTNKISKFRNNVAVPASMPSSTIANFSSDLNHIATANTEGSLSYETPDWNYALNTTNITYKNLVSDTGKLLVNLYNEERDWLRNASSINFIPDTHNMLIGFFRKNDTPFPGDNRNISEAIVVDYNVPVKSGSYPMWKKKMCGFRGGIVGEKPPKTWTGEYDLGCFTGWEKSYSEGLSGFFPNVKVGENICKCDEGPGFDRYNRWMWNNPTLSYASGRTWAVHLRRSPWQRDRDNASVFRWKSICEEFPEWGSDQVESGHIQKAYSHVINNYDDVKIWISGWMHDPCPPWPLDTWDSNLDIDIELPPTESISDYDVTVSDNIKPDGSPGENDDVVPMSVRNCAKYPSWVPVPPPSSTNKKLGYSYQGRWIKNGSSSQWAQGLYGITGTAACGFTGNVEDIVQSFGISAAYQPICTECEKAWTEEKPMGDMHVSDSHTIYVDD